MIDINRLLQRLCDSDIDFVIVGGFAATLHGSSLVTRDLDVCAILSSENVAKLRDASSTAYGPPRYKWSCSSVPAASFHLMT